MMSLGAKDLLDKIDVTSKVCRNLTNNGLGLGSVALNFPRWWRSWIDDLDRVESTLERTVNTASRSCFCLVTLGVLG